MQTSAEPARERAAALAPEGRAFVDGAPVDSASGRTFECRSAVDGRVLAAVARCGEEDVARAAAAARAAFEDGRWSRLPPRERGRVLVRLSELVEENAEELALLETIDMGKPISDARSADVPATALCLRWYGESLDKLYGEIAPVGEGAVALVTREPVGVVAAIVPWNFPLMMAAWKIGPALGAGNSLILKPAEQSPLSALRLAALAAEAGVPDGVLQVLPGFGEEAGRALALSGDVDAVAFTGSGEVGKLIMQYAGQSNMKQVSLECGGKSPNVVFADAADLDAAADAAAWGVFFNQGEVCSAGSRLVAHESVRDELVEKIVRIASAMRLGDPLDPGAQIGAIVSEEQFERVMGHIEGGRAEGAELRLGGSEREVVAGGRYIEPTVFDGVDNSMGIAQEEIFGPVLSVIPFREPEEAVRIANGTRYGLGAAVWTRDIDRAFAFARRMRSGSVWVNVYDKGDISVPFGGYKQSGFGRDKSLHALDKYCQLKTTWIELSGPGASLSSLGAAPRGRARGPPRGRARAAAGAGRAPPRPAPRPRAGASCSRSTSPSRRPRRRG